MARSVATPAQAQSSDGQHADVAGGSLRGDAGARERVQQARTDGHYVELKVDDPGILQDIDTPADVQ